MTDPDKTPPIEKTLADLHASPAGLTSNEAQQRLRQYGPNALQEKKVSPLMRFLYYFWGPIPWMIEVAAILSAAVGHWADLTIISLRIGPRSGSISTWSSIHRNIAISWIA